jgi:hypothetical protein
MLEHAEFRYELPLDPPRKLADNRQHKARNRAETVSRDSSDECYVLLHIRVQRRLRKRKLGQPGQIERHKEGQTARQPAASQRPARRICETSLDPHNA